MLAHFKRPSLIAWFLAFVLVALAAATANAASVTPTVIPDGTNTNKTCAVVMPGTLELKVADGTAGTYTSDDHTLTATIVKPSTLAGSLNSVDWSSNIPVVGVIVKDGVDGANWYNYGSPGSTGDTYLTTPLNGARGISHVSFCYYPYYPLTAQKTAAGTYDRTVTWDLTKSVDPANLTGYAGQNAGTATWTVTATKNELSSNFSVAGEITVYNPNTFAVGFEVTDVLSDGTAAAVTCPPGTIPANGSVKCTYTAAPSSKDATKNTAVVKSLYTGKAEATAEAAITWSEHLIGYDSGLLTDARFNYSKSIADSTSFDQPETFSCPADPKNYTDGKYQLKETNTAVLDSGIDKSASADVTVTCYAPVVRKDANPSFTRTWTWTIDKVGDQTKTTLAVGQPFLVNYEVTVKATSLDSGFAVAGTIYVDNPSAAPMTVDVSDKLSDGTVATVDCGGGSTSLTVPAGTTGTCSYTAALTDASSRTNTATASLMGAPFTGTAGVDFTKATMHEVDECVDVTDDQKGALGTVCAGAVPKTFKYSMDAGSYAACGTYTFDNTATFKTNDTFATGSDSWSVAATVPCLGCTLTQGYWKTHSSHGPAPYDDGWLKIGSAGADTELLHQRQDLVPGVLDAARRQRLL